MCVVIKKKEEKDFFLSPPRKLPLLLRGAHKPVACCGVGDAPGHTLHLHYRAGDCRVGCTRTGALCA